MRSIFTSSRTLDLNLVGKRCSFILWTYLLEHKSNWCKVWGVGKLIQLSTSFITTVSLNMIKSALWNDQKCTTRFWSTHIARLVVRQAKIVFPIWNWERQKGNFKERVIDTRIKIVNRVFEKIGKISFLCIPRFINFENLTWQPHHTKYVLSSPSLSSIYILLLGRTSANFLEPKAFIHQYMLPIISIYLEIHVLFLPS